MSDLTKQELKDKLEKIKTEYGVFSVHFFVEDLTKIINEEVLKALSDVKSKAQHMTEYEDNTSYDAVPLSAIEEIEKRYV